MARLVASIARLAEARLKEISRRTRVRLALMAGCAVAGLLAAGFALAALAVALAHSLGTVGALLVMAALALALLLGLLVALAREERLARRRAARREALDRQLLRAAALSALPRRAPSRAVVGLGLGLVAVGALLVLLRDRNRD